MCLIVSGAASAKPTTDPTKYNVPEYYQHDNYSFYDLDISLGKHRLPQPSKFDPLVPKNWQQPPYWWNIDNDMYRADIQNWLCS